MVTKFRTLPYTRDAPSDLLPGVMPPASNQGGKHPGAGKKSPDVHTILEEESSPRTNGDHNRNGILSGNGVSPFPGAIEPAKLSIDLPPDAVDLESTDGPTGKSDPASYDLMDRPDPKLLWRCAIRHSRKSRNPARKSYDSVASETNPCREIQCLEQNHEPWLDMDTFLEVCALYPCAYS